MEYFDDLVKETKNEFAGKVAEGVSAGDVTDFIDYLSDLVDSDFSSKTFISYTSLTLI